MQPHHVLLHQNRFARRQGPVLGGPYSTRIPYSPHCQSLRASADGAKVLQLKEVAKGTLFALVITDPQEALDVAQTISPSTLRRWISHRRLILLPYLHVSSSPRFRPGESTAGRECFEVLPGLAANHGSTDTGSVGTCVPSTFSFHAVL